MTYVEKMMFEHFFRDYGDKLGPEERKLMTSARKLIEEGDEEAARYQMARIERTLSAVSGAVQAIRLVCQFGQRHYDDFRDMGLIPKDLK